MNGLQLEIENIMKRDLSIGYCDQWHDDKEVTSKSIRLVSKQILSIHNNRIYQERKKAKKSKWKHLKRFLYECLQMAKTLERNDD